MTRISPPSPEHSQPPLPRYFGPAGSCLFGWLHPVRAGTTATLGLVLCNPFGFEEVCAHRSLRHLAMAAAAAGVPTLRFDYAGTGDSPGDEFDTDRLKAWLLSVHQAIDHLKASTGVRQVCLLGIRLGATLAALAAIERTDVAGLVAIAPVVKGRDHIRELRMLGQSTAKAAPVAPAEHAILQSAGFSMSADTVDALKVVNLRALAKSPAAHVLIVERDDVPAGMPWCDDLVGLGADARVASWPGYALMMTNPQDAEIPLAMFEGVLAELALWQRGLPAMRGSPIDPGLSVFAGTHTVLQAGPGTAISETIVHIQSVHSTLFGIVTRATDSSVGRRPGVLMLNSGSVHHIGPNRLWVTLARRWAARGFTVLRIDLSGIADSPARDSQPENKVYTTEAGRDITGALAYLRRTHEVGECHLIGLCSGAFHALKAVEHGQAIKAALMINPLTYSWEDSAQSKGGLNEYEILTLSRTYGRRVLSVEPWLRLMRGDLHVSLIAQVLARRVLSAARHGVSQLRQALGMAVANELVKSLGAAVRHGVQLRFVFAAGDPGHELLQREGGKALRRLLLQGRVSIDVVSGGDHTFTEASTRERLTAVLDHHLLADLPCTPVAGPIPVPIPVALRPFDPAQ